MTLWATPAGRRVKGSALAASFSALSGSRSTAVELWMVGLSEHPGSKLDNVVDRLSVRAASLTSERSHSLPTAVQRPSADAARAIHFCDNCGDPIVGRKPNCTFCSTCACEREREHVGLRTYRKWQRVLGDPELHDRRLERRRVREFDRRIDEPNYRQLVNRRSAAAQHRRYLRLQMDRDCIRCGLALGVKYVGAGNHRRLSPRRLHTICLRLNRDARNARNSRLRRDARIAVAA